ncbi:MAG TPA: hypothetical protein IAC25_05860 [Candidatus Enterenecus stercoripullorum]|nr:hypothetical protein [Candidatus Enterenecus stercoripullorum]
MRSGTSCFNSTVFRKQMTRFWPIWAGWLLILLLALPLQGFMALQRDAQGMRDQLEQFAQSQVLYLCNNSGYMTALAVLVGLLAAMAACSHLYSTRSANFMGALPVRREGLFLSHYLAGLVMVLGPVLIAFGLTVLVELAGDCLMLDYLGYWLGYTCAAGFFFYSFAVFLGMFTGHLLALPAFYLIFNVLALAVVGMLEWVLESFYYGFGSLPAWVHRAVTWLTPVWGFSSVWIDRTAMAVENGSALWAYPLVALVLAVAALLLYRRRNLESAGDVVAVRVMRPVFKYGVAFCAGMFLGMATAQMLGLAEPGLMIAIFLWGVTGYFVAQMLLDKSFRVWRRWKGAVGVAVVFAALFALVGFDLTGFETRVPRTDAVASVSVQGLSGQPWDSGSEVGATLEDPEQIAAVIALHQAIVDRRPTGTQRGGDSASGNSGVTSFQVSYRLEDGSILSRSYRSVSLDQELLTLAGTVRNDPDVIYQSYGFDEVERRRGVLTTTIWENGPDTSDAYGQQAEKLLEAVLEDIGQGRLGQRVVGGADTPGYEEYRSIQFEWRWRTDQGQAEYEYYFMELILPDTATSTLAVLEELSAGAKS